MLTRAAGKSPNLHQSASKLCFHPRSLPQGNRFTGTIPPSYGNASSLTILSLASNQLTGSVPASFRDGFITLLDLSNNALSGNLSYNVNLPPTLIKLDVSNNNIASLDSTFCPNTTASALLTSILCFNNPISFPGCLPGGYCGTASPPPSPPPFSSPRPSPPPLPPFSSPRPGPPPPPPFPPFSSPSPLFTSPSFSPPLPTSSPSPPPTSPSPPPASPSPPPSPPNPPSPPRPVSSDGTVAAAQQTVASALSALQNGDATGAISLVQAATNLLNGDGVRDTQEAAFQRQAILQVINSALVLAPVSTPTDGATAAVLLSNVTRNTSQITPQAQSLASQALVTVASAPPQAVAAAGTAQALLNSASNVSAAALTTIAQSAPSVDPSVLPNLLTVTDRVATTQVAQLTAAGQSTSFTTPQIQLTVQLIAPNQTTAGVFAAPITAPGSAASFDPLPASALASVPASEKVQSQFVSLGFDPYSDAASQTKRTGVTRLKFSTASSGAEVAVRALNEPITFTLPAVPGLTDASSGAGAASAAGLKADCAFWDPAASRYSTDGCAALPNPLPAGVAATWNSGIVAKSQADLYKVRWMHARRCKLV